MKSIQQANIDAAIERMEEGKRTKNINIFKEGKQALSMTLEAIKNVDAETYYKYSPFLSDEF